MAIDVSHITDTPTPTDARRRALAPDLARGFMLLAIALAHTPLLVLHTDYGPDWLNRAGEFFNHLLVNNQARPLFVFLFGYGIAQLTLRQQRRGEEWPSIRKLLRRRGFWLIVIGFVHCVVLVPLDIVAVYGLALVICAGMARAKNSTLLWSAGIFGIPATAFAAFGTVFTELMGKDGGVLTASMPTDPFAAMQQNLIAWPVGLIVALPMVLPGMFIGVWAARRRILDDPETHRSLLRRVAVLGIGVALITRLPAALVFTDGVLDAPFGLSVALSIVAPVTGYVGGIGMAALIGLAAIRLDRTGGRVTTALVALGQRSLTFYVFQSVMYVVLFYPYGFGLTDNMGFGGASLVAVGIWVVSVAAAEWMRRHDLRGPLETLLRTLSYRSKPART